VSDLTLRELACDSCKERLRQGDETALVDVNHFYAPGVAHAVRVRFPFFSQADVDDVLAVAVFRLWQGRHKLDQSRGRLPTLLCHIALQVAVDVCRHGWQKARRREVSLDALNGSDRAAKRKGVEASAVADPKTIADLRRIIDALPHSYRLIVLADIAAHDRVASVEYLAAELDVAPGTVRVYRNRAYATIRREMQKLGYEVP
jgi:DNA-directed RNA polymerase specialized sigma24 family protein